MIKERMASLRVAQVTVVVPACLRRRILRNPQPRGNHPRRPGGADVKNKCVRVAQQLLREKVISEAAANYLQGWAQGTRGREARPPSYSFLRHRWCPTNPGLPREDARYSGGDGRAPCVRVAILGVSGEPLPNAEEEHGEDDAPWVALDANFVPIDG